MKVFLIQASNYSPQTERSMPLGVMYLASYLRQVHGCQVDLFDMQLLAKTPGPAVQKAIAMQPDIVAISGMTPDAREVEQLAHEVKKALPETTVIVGGAHATNYPEDLMANPAIDYLITHEGETALGAFTEYVGQERTIESVPGLIYRKNGDMIRNDPAPFIDDVDHLPFPAYDLLDLEAYYKIPRCGVIFRHKRYAAITTSRGCPYRCAYCHKVHGHKWRPRSAENVVDEMQQLVETYGIGDFVIMDDMFNLKPERVNRIAELILERRLDIGLSFPIGLRGDIMTEKSIRLLKQAGMFHCMYAVESASVRIQKMLRKNNNLERILEIIEYTRNQGVMVHGSFMLGFPTETEAEARATVEMAIDSKLHSAAFYRVIPFRGTELCKMAEETGFQMDDDLQTYEFHRANTVNASLIDDDVLLALKQSAYRRFFLSPKRLWAIFKVLPNRMRLLPELFFIWLRKAFIW